MVINSTRTARMFRGLMLMNTVRVPLVARVMGSLVTTTRFALIAQVMGSLVTTTRITLVAQVMGSLVTTTRINAARVPLIDATARGPFIDGGLVTIVGSPLVVGFVCLFDIRRLVLLL